MIETSNTGLDLLLELTRETGQSVYYEYKNVGVEGASKGYALREATHFSGGVRDELKPSFGQPFSAFDQGREAQCAAQVSFIAFILRLLKHDVVSRTEVGGTRLEVVRCRVT